MLPAVAVTAVFLLLLLVAEHRGSATGKWLSKPVASLGFIGLALASDATGSPYGLAVLAALVLSLIGDVLLIPKDKRAFLAGLVSFLLGHVAFVVAFVLRGLVLQPAAIALVLLLPAAALVLAWLWPHLQGRMRGPVIAYVVVITSMVTAAVGTAGHTFDPRLVAGAVLFFLSDLFVARNRFITPAFSNRLVGLPLYYAGQVLLASTVDGHVFAPLVIPLVSHGGI